MAHDAIDHFHNRRAVFGTDITAGAKEIPTNGIHWNPGCHDLFDDLDCALYAGRWGHRKILYMQYDSYYPKRYTAYTRR